MGKRFTEYSQFDLSQVNKDVLKKWDENQVFAKSMTERDSCFSKDLPRLMVCRVFTM